ncbi:hypothetical protein EDB81DRAFT_768207 [Dactylonectria macrodidyma]|uniref:Uncharacterized protein n=1 Tax=Dactylonectria macrodidyma TaxID=307937 RepID=A0A9P9D5X5_9HYPO|nr:hypothetical protein EDB81DRAFT_768207 [Dactylonectria macrodidyma]
MPASEPTRSTSSLTRYLQFATKAAPSTLAAWGSPSLWPILPRAWRTLVGPEEAICLLERIILPEQSPFKVQSFLELPRLVELRVFLSKVPEDYYPPEASEFRHHCPTDHCDLWYEKYSPWPNREKPLCPACGWAMQFTNVGILGLAPHQDLMGFMITYDSLLPMFPSAEEIRRARNPIIRFIRDPDQPQQMTIDDPWNPTFQGGGPSLKEANSEADRLRELDIPDRIVLDPELGMLLSRLPLMVVSVRQQCQHQ